MTKEKGMDCEVKKAIGWLTLVAMVYCCIFSSAAQSTVWTPVEKTMDTQTYVCTPSMDDNFLLDSVIITMKNQYSAINKEWDPEQFLPVEVSEITDLRPIPSEREAEYRNKPEFRTILKLTLSTPGKESVLQAVQTLQSREDVLAAEPDYVGDVCTTTPNDTLYSAQTYISATQIDKVWDFTTGSTSVTVGVFDSGIGAHEDLSGNVVSGYNYTSSSTSTNDTGGHGTAAASVIGAVGNNDMGITGVCWNVKLKPYKVNKTSAYVIQALSQAELDGVPIVNLSVSFNPETLTALRTAVSDYSGLLVCSAGNEGNDLGTVLSYPSCFDLSNILSVGACDNAGNPASYSNTGDVEVDIFAPGHLAIIDIKEDQYKWNDGTSLSAPLVAGVAALLKSYKPSLTTAQLKAAIMDGATSKAALKDKCVSGGMLNAYGALQRVTGKLKNYYTEVKIASNSNLSTLSCRVVYNTSKVYHTWSAFGPAAANNNLPLDIEPGKVAFFRSPNTSALTASGVLFKSKFSMPASNTLYTADLRFEKISPPTNSYVSMQKYLMGDINGDGTIDSADSLLAMQYSVGTTSLTDMQKMRADVNFDGSINSTDSMMINQYGVDVIRTFW